MADFKLLVVDDEEQLREVIVESLENVAQVIKTAENGQRALEMLEKENFDAILSDIGMPVMDGLTFLSHVRARGIETPFVFLTAFGDKDNIQTALKLGANDFLDKPFTSAGLCEVMTNALQLGVRLREFDELFELCASEGDSSREEVLRMKEVRKAILAMRARTYIPAKKTG